VKGIALTSTGLRPLASAALPRPLKNALWSAYNAAAAAQQMLFERRLGVSTAGHDYLEDGLGSEHVFYEGCEWIPVRRALAALEPGPADVFVDLGSGKGQGMLIAAGLPYGRVLGVELSESWHQAAERNIAQARPHLRCSTVWSQAADVLTWPIPDDLTTVFMYSPFTGQVFRAAAQRLFDSYDRFPRPLHIVYDYPWEHDWLISTGRVVVEDVRPAQWPAKPWWWRTGWVIVTYRVVAASAASIPPLELPRRPLRPARAVARWTGPNENRFVLTRPGAAPVYSRP